jgi:ATP-binding cassette subfamily F protein uup
MARAPLLQLSNLSLTFGGNPLFDGIDMTVQEGDRLALVGRNGSGKSTLMKLMAGFVDGDKGLRVVPPGITVGYMEQEPEMKGFETLGDYAASRLDVGENGGWRSPPRGWALPPRRRLLRLRAANVAGRPWPNWWPRRRS